MARLIYGEAALKDLERLAGFLLEIDPVAAATTAELIVEAVSVLARHPLIGRPAEEEPLQELVISRGRTGYVALYSHEPAEDVVIVLSLRHQREAGYGSTGPP